MGNHKPLILASRTDSIFLAGNPRPKVITKRVAFALTATSAKIGTVWAAAIPICAIRFTASVTVLLFLRATCIWVGGTLLLCGTRFVKEALLKTQTLFM